MAETCQGDLRSSWLAMRENLRQAAVALTRSHEDAEDLTQQVFAQVLAKRPEFIGHVGYVRRTMFRLWLGEQRSVRRRVRRIARLALGITTWSLDVDTASDDEYAEAVRRAIDTLPPNQHVVVVLRLIEELDYDEIADTLGCPVGAVRANLHLARKKLRRMIGEPP